MKSRWTKFLLCLLTSALFWLVYNLSQDYPDTENASVQIRSRIEGRAEEASGVVLVAARCVTTGFGHIELSSRRKAVRIDVDPADFEYVGGNTFRIPASNLYKYASRIFDDRVTIESFASDYVLVDFAEVSHRKVPVIPALTVSCKPQYAPAGPLELVPDSVVVYAPPARLATVESVMTRPLALRDLGRSGARGKVRLDVPSDVKLSDLSVSYNLQVKRYVEVSGRVPVTARNVPAGVDLAILPSSVQLKFRCEFPVVADPLQTVECYVDYHDFAASISGSCVIRCGGVPAGVIDYTVTPEVCECLEFRNGQ